MPLPHEVLQVPPDAAKSDVEAAYRRLTMYADPANAEYRATLDAARMAMLGDEPPKAAEPAPTAAYRSGADFTVGGVFSRTFSTLCRRPWVFIGITLVAWVPSTILRFILGTGQPFTAFMTYVIAYTLGMIVQGAISYAALQELRGDVATMGESLAQSASRIAPLLGASLLAGLGFVLGMVLLIVPGLILMCAWAVVTPACVVERLGPVKSLKRSNALTKGYRWKIFGLIMLVGIASGVIGFVAAFATGLIVPWNKTIATLVSSLVTLLPQTFGCLMNPVIYYSLRSTKEGVSIDSLANVFD